MSCGGETGRKKNSMKLSIKSKVLNYKKKNRHSCLFCSDGQTGMPDLTDICLLVCRIFKKMILYVFKVIYCCKLKSETVIARHCRSNPVS